MEITVNIPDDVIESQIKQAITKSIGPIIEDACRQKVYGNIRKIENQIDKAVKQTIDDNKEQIDKMISGYVFNAFKNEIESRRE